MTAVQPRPIVETDQQIEIEEFAWLRSFGRSWETIAHDRGISLPTLKQKLHRARRDGLAVPE